MTSGEIAILTLGAILELSDQAEAVGGAGTIHGVAALHKLQSCIQKNKPRIRAMVFEAAGQDTDAPAPRL